MFELYLFVYINFYNRFFKYLSDNKKQNTFMRFFAFYINHYCAVLFAFHVNL